MTVKKNYRDVEDHIPVFAISIAAELSGLHPQTLRQYDKLGIVSPSRQGGTRRLYSRIDIAKLKYVAQLTSEGVNLEGVKRILALENHIRGLEAKLVGVIVPNNSKDVELWKSRRTQRT
jgi:MerR family transcriptional regulator/heat shock protein HspR